MPEGSLFASVDEDARRRFEAQWNAGSPQPIEAFLPPPHLPHFLPTLEELVHIELELVWKRGQQPAISDATVAQLPQLEGYLARFPQLRQTDILERLIRQEFRVRQLAGDQPTVSEYAERFPDLRLDAQDSDTWAHSSRRTAASADRAIPRSNSLPSIPGYEFLEILGRGGMGVVYKARQTSLQRFVALKMIRGGAADADEVARFRTEAEAVARLQHPNIVQIFEVREHEGEPFFSLEFVNGGSLSRYLKSTPLAPRAAAELIATLAHAIHYAHENGIVHRDLKPANILLAANSKAESRNPKQIRSTKSENSEATACEQPGLENSDFVYRSSDFSPKITDFGLAKRLEDTSGQTRTGAVMGTPSYMAPEQAAGKTRDVGPAADVYALGAILYEAITGRPPFIGDSVIDVLEQVRTREPTRPTQLQPRLHRDLEVIALKALAKEPRQRYATARALAEDLERFSAGEPILARPIGRLQRTWHRLRRHPLAVTACLAVVCMFVILGVWFSQWQQGNRERILAAEKNRLIQAIEPALVQPELSLTSVQRTSARLDQLTLLDAEQGQRKRDYFLSRVKQTLESTLRRNTRLQVLELKEIERILNWFEQAAPVRAKSALKLLADRKSGWQTIAHLEAPLSAQDEPFAESVLGEVRSLLAKSSSASPRGPSRVAYTRSRSLAHGEAVGVFAPGWDRAVQVGLWLNAVQGHSGPVTSLAFSGDGSTLISAGGGFGGASEVIAWNVASGTPRWVYPDPSSGALEISYSTSADLVAVGSTSSASIAILDAASGAVVRRLEGTPGATVTALAFSPDGQWLMAGLRGKSVEIPLWETATWQQQASLPGASSEIGRAVFSPDSELLATCGTNGQVKIWEVDTQKELFATAPLSFGFMPSARFTGDAKKLVATGNISKKATNVPYSLLIWDRATGQAAQDLDVGIAGSSVASMDIAANGQLVLSQSGARESLVLYDLQKRQQLLTLNDKAISAAVSRTHSVLEFSPQADVLAAGARSGKVLLLDLRNSAILRTFDRLGYGFILCPARTSDVGGDPSLHGVRERDGKFAMQITRHDVVLSEQVIRADQVPAGPLTILAKREGDKLVFQVNDLPLLEFHDLLPWSDGGAGQFAVQCPAGIVAERLTLLRRDLPAQPTELERGDALFAQGKLDQARDAYRVLTLTEGDSEIGKEAQFKMAICLLTLERLDEAGAAFEKLVSQSGTRWEAVAGCQLLLLRAQQGRLDETDALLDVLSNNHTIEELRPLVGKDVQDQLMRHYVRDFLGAELIYKLRTVDARHLDRIVKLFDFFKVPREERFALELSILRAYHRSGDLDKANRLAEDILALDYWVQEDNRIAFLRQTIWLLRQQGKYEEALRLADRYLDSGSGQWQPHFLHLVPERARTLISLGRASEAEKDVDDYIAKTLPGFYSYFANACLLQGFLRHQRGDNTGARASWQRSTYKNWCAEMAKLDPKFTATPLGNHNSSDVLLGIMAAALVDEFPDAEAAALVAQIAQRAGNDPGFTLLRDRIPAGLVREMWQTPRGLDCARKLVLLDLTYEDYLRIPPVLALVEYFRAGAVGDKLSAEQDEIFWSISEKMHKDYTSGKVGAPQFLALLLTWKGTTNFLGWDGVSPSLDPMARSHLAYVLGFRFQRLQRPDDARRFFETALRDGSDNAKLQRLAQRELDKLKK